MGFKVMGKAVLDSFSSILRTSLSTSSLLHYCEGTQVFSLN